MSAVRQDPDLQIVPTGKRLKRIRPNCRNRRPLKGLGREDVIKVFESEQCWPETPEPEAHGGFITAPSRHLSVTESVALPPN